ncbi:MAG: LPS export ABC transporter permease LptF [Hyphomicrobium sp.]
MNIFARYVFRQAAGALLLILASLGGVVWIGLALRELNVVTTSGQSGWTLLAMTTLALPNLLAIIAPIALLIACIHTLNRLNSDSELIVLTASGATVWTAARPLLLLAFMVMIAVSAVNHAVMPWSLRQLRETVMQLRTDLLTQVIQPGKFSSPEAGLTLHIRERAANGELRGLIMDDSRNRRQSQSYLAEHGVIVKQDGTAYLVMREGHVVQRNDPKKAAEILAFETYTVDLDNFEAKSQGPVDLKPRERYFSELIAPEPASQAFKLSPGQFTAELHERFSNPLYPFAFVMIALAAAGQAKSTRQNRLQSLTLGFLAAIVCRLSGLAINNIVVLNSAAVPLMYAIPLATAAFGGLLVMRGPRPWPGSQQAGELIDMAKDRLARLPRLPRLWPQPAVRR